MYKLIWRDEATENYNSLKTAAESRQAARKKKGKKKSSKDEGLFKQVHKNLKLLAENPRHPGLHTHEFSSLPHPWGQNEKVFVAYAQNETPGAYRIFWCYGPERQQITLIAITPHP